MGAFSDGALTDIVRKRNGQSFEHALDLGSGIGRVTQAILRKHCQHVDLVEFIKKHLNKAKETLASKRSGKCSFSFHNTAVQKFEIQPVHYDLIWCQWLLMYLTDADALDLLKRLALGISSQGMLI